MSNWMEGLKLAEKITQRHSIEQAEVQAEQMIETETGNIEFRRGFVSYIADFYTKKLRNNGGDLIYRYRRDVNA